jgi:hypothetical protein
MLRTTALVLLLSFLPAAAAEKADKAPARPIGTWARETDGHKVSFTFRADNTLTIKVAAEGGKSVEVTGAYGVTGEGMLFGVMTKVESTIDGGPEKGDLFGFTYSVSKGELTLSDFKGTKSNDRARKLIEGAYTKK